MHKDVPVLTFELDETNQIKKVIEIFNLNHLPFSTDRDINLNHKSIIEWWRDRSIPLTRDEYSNIKKALPDDDPYSLVVKAHALSLDDQYWIKNKDENINYDDISFFSNKFSNDIGDIIVGNKESGDINYYSPDSTSNGNLKKRWKIINGEKYLLKAGTKPNQYEIFNEIIASAIMELLNIDHVSYSLIIDDGHIYCGSKNFISYNEDFVTAYQLRCSKKQQNDVSLYNHLLSIYESLNIPNHQEKIDQMLFIDFLIGNVDRHLNNFGVIRDAKTLEFIRATPIYDSGSSLGYDLTDEELSNALYLDWKPFQSQKNKTQLDLIKDYSWLNIDALKTIPYEVNNLLLKYNKYVSNVRRELIISFIVKRLNLIFRHLGISYEIEFNSFELNQLERRIIKYVESNNNELINLTGLIKETSFSYITIYRAVSNLTKKGVLKRIGSNKNGYWKLSKPI